MASNAPGACCLERTFHVNTYVTGEKSDKVIVILTDVYGNKFNNVLLIADELSKNGYYVLIPDILKGDVCTPETDIVGTWLPKHSSEITRPIVESFINELTKDIDTKFLGLIGYCYGAKYVVQQLTNSTKVTAGAIAHPSFVSIDEVSQITKPILISAAEVDSIFTDDLRRETELKLREIKARYQIDFFGGVSHGYSVRGDISNEVVKYAKEKTLYDQLYWFNTFAGK
ncbi:Carboxymethylenebutenolidase [Wickerhamomyces ciferrii]|uniref:Carboxymethylenebutenolidase n=1 Tax=Wickerhamomyces ciferrii (strain ATCC 14091 / BCRC 22168 / CBS 111 / JCM 3599 / NBRC 0793 / NRRL Y-1031 F-60-10) TaxID=1206466 RepID=K0KTV7_WICCF|nr:Carboxymethylenebutenolidase [Wickerhamomyces ciferrii]CCH46616.1 Carboxymethylenebutenolidase [Wickerhamomyces ciferrii]